MSEFKKGEMFEAPNGDLYEFIEHVDLGRYMFDRNVKLRDDYSNKIVLLDLQEFIEHFRKVSK